tara:strand:+ start:2502 stop:3008 length:507 start_codon:yes stop_codon:yes gene_type:complete
MNRLIKILLLLTTWACQNSKSEIQGVWYATNPSAPDRHYFEAHITDTGFVVVNDVTLSYAATYEMYEDTLIQNVRDIYNDFRIYSTVKFMVKVTPDSMKLVNASNPDLSSKWTRISNLEPFDFFAADSLDQFAIELKNRYKKNYLEIYKPQSIEGNLKDFDVYWIDKK